MKSGSSASSGITRPADVLKRTGSSYFIFLLSIFFLSNFTIVSASARAQGKLPPPLKQDESCLACHGQAGMTAGNGKKHFGGPRKTRRERTRCVWLQGLPR
jgi:hypothetical protein